jgi:hypothetical protein
MSEPRLEDIGDYDTLKGQKKKIVWIVIITGLIIGAMYVVAYNIYDNKDDTIEVKEKIDKISHNILNKNFN